MTNASNGDQEKVAIRRGKRVYMIDLLAELADYITAKCQGNRIMLLSSGFTLNKEKGDATMPEIKEVQLTAELPGQAITRIRKVAGAKSYIHQYTIDPLADDSQRVSEVVAETTFTFNGLQSMKRYQFRVIAVGIKGQKVYSPMVKRVIQ